MNKRPPVDASARLPQPQPRQPHRRLLVVSSVALAAWVIFLLLVALRFV